MPETSTIRKYLGGLLIIKRETSSQFTGLGASAGRYSSMQGLETRQTDSLYVNLPFGKRFPVLVIGSQICQKRT